MLKIAVHTALLDSLNESDHLKEFAVFISLKKLFKNSCIYKASYNIISRKSGISVSVLKQCIPFFKMKGWAREHCGNLVLNNIWNLDDTGIKKKELITLKILNDDGYKQTLKRLKLLLIRACKNRFDSIKKLSKDDTNPVGGSHKEKIKRYKKARKFFSNPLRKKITEIEEFSISNKKVGSIIKKSRSSASRLMKWGMINKILILKSNFSSVVTPGFKENPEFKKSNYFLGRNGSILKQGANYVSFI